MTLKFLYERFILHKHRDYLERKVKKLALKFHGDLFVDVGCNRKAYTALVSRNFRRTITIDPNPKWNADLQIALSNFTGTAPFYIGDDNGSADSLLRNPYIHGREWPQQAEPLQVQVEQWDMLRLDADLVKIDVEGAELDVVDGMNKYLPRNVIVEAHDERRERELLDRMSGKGYLPTRIDDTHWLFAWRWTG